MKWRKKASDNSDDTIREARLMELARGAVADHDKRSRPWAHHLICPQCDPEGCFVDDWAREVLKLPLRWRLAHQPVRPAWSCDSCPEPWPCPAARSDLAVGYADDQVTLLVYLCHMLSQAAADLDGITADELRSRFLPLLLPEVPAGTRLYLAPADWYHPGGDRPGSHYRDIVVARVHTGQAHATHLSVWVSGHELDCTWPNADPHPPCVELRVRADAIQRAVQAGPPP
ncbi:hypothetical protein GCM10027280_33660 [Micromonospora polyrhachis]|uniref:Uncharacterized protein n=1 Tax=Micromonospora polyrhachis TaxID=1282883 RepID=A0A7W7SSJ5_9ACTN|nr:hypothetical protein [Micromonospora polyrhachis]MBB4959562.1 hypothetical protein [Micromonospora polyrhachis]